MRRPYHALTLASRGHKLIIEASGDFSKEVEEGSYINLSVKYGLITLVRTKADLCEQLKEVDEDCPLEGKKNIRKEVDIPKEVPPVCLHISQHSFPFVLRLMHSQGTYTVLADVYSKDNKRITCLEASVHFGL